MNLTTHLPLVKGLTIILAGGPYRKFKKLFGTLNFICVKLNFQLSPVSSIIIKRKLTMHGEASVLK
jgi:hypothetical protein